MLLADVVENFRNMCTKIYELDSGNFLSAPWLAWQAAFKKAKVKLELLTDIDMLSMVEKGSEEEYVMQFIITRKLSTNIWMVMIKIKNESILNIGM